MAFRGAEHMREGEQRVGPNLRKVGLERIGDGAARELLGAFELAAVGMDACSNASADGEVDQVCAPAELFRLERRSLRLVKRAGRVERLRQLGGHRRSERSLSDREQRVVRATEQDDGVLVGSCRELRLGRRDPVCGVHEPEAVFGENSLCLAIVRPRLLEPPLEACELRPHVLDGGLDIGAGVLPLGRGQRGLHRRRVCRAPHHRPAQPTERVAQDGAIAGTASMLRSLRGGVRGRPCAAPKPLDPKAGHVCLRQPALVAGLLEAREYGRQLALRERDGVVGLRVDEPRDADDRRVRPCLRVGFR